MFNGPIIMRGRRKHTAARLAGWHARRPGRGMSRSLFLQRGDPPSPIFTAIPWEGVCARMDSWASRVPQWTV